jgi:hypothetical protein
MWECPQCQGDSYQTDNCQWVSTELYFMEYQCEECHCVYSAYLKDIDGINIVIDGIKKQ